MWYYCTSHVFELQFQVNPSYLYQTISKIWLQNDLNFVNRIEKLISWVLTQHSKDYKSTCRSKHPKRQHGYGWGKTSNPSGYEGSTVDERLGLVWSGLSPCWLILLFWRDSCAPACNWKIRLSHQWLQLARMSQKVEQSDGPFRTSVGWAPWSIS